ncbi:MAG TPA: ketoacyl-ACP synthase III [Candidatus Dorea intestinavium]|nr:ketoacyl-ACP synthase III [Candidatus Dorea intestinavium]
MIGKITGIGTALPKYVMDNEELSTMVETTDQWIRERTGIRTRHIARNGETTTSLAIEAAKEALKAAKIEAASLDLIIVSTNTAIDLMPNTACEIQKEIGAFVATCFDITVACSGFVFAYNTVLAYMRANMCKKALIVGSETLSNVVDWSDRGSCILFGDGAGAVVLEEDDSENFKPLMSSMGAKGEALTLTNSFGKARDFMAMDGSEVFKFAVASVPKIIEELLMINQFEKEKIKYYVLHQANKRIIDAVAKRLKEPLDKFPTNVENYGNTSSASIPILLKEMDEKNSFKKGDYIVMVGFGAGLSLGATILKW